MQTGTTGRKPFVGYEYKEFAEKAEYAMMLVDCYENFGWIVDEANSYQRPEGIMVVRMRRDRKIANRMELTRLQRHFESCVVQLKSLEKDKVGAATAISLAVGLVGTAFMAGAVFAAVHEPPIIWLCVLMAVPAFIGWLMPCFIYKAVLKKEALRVQPLIDEKYEEIYAICEKGNSLL